MLQAEQMTTLERKIGTFSEILAKKPDDDLTILALAEACFRRGVKLEALKAYQEVISRSPVPEAHLAVAEIYADQSMFAEAYGELRQLFVLDPNSVEARLLILELQGKSTPPDDLAEIMRKPTSEDAFEEAKVRLKIQKTIHTRELQERTRNVTLEPGIVIHEYYVEEAKKKLIGVDDQLKELQRLRESNRVLSQPPRPQVMAPERPADSGFTPTGMIPDVAVTPDLPDMAPPEMPESGEIPSPVGSGEVPSPMGSGEIPSPVDSGEFSSPVDSGESPAVEPAAAVPEFAGLSPIGDLPPPPEVPEPVGPVSTEPSAVIPDSPDPLAMAPELPSPPEPPMPMVPEAISPVAPSEPVAAIPEPPAPMAPPEPPAPVAPEPVAITPELPAPPEPPAPMVPEPPAPVAPLEPVAKLPEPPAPVDFPEPPSPVAPPEPMMPEPNASVAEPPAPVAPPEPAMPGPPTPLMPEPIAVMPDPPAPITPEPPAPPAPVEPSPPEPLAVLPEPPAMPEPPTFEPMMPEPPAPIAPPEPTATIQPLEPPAPVAPEPPAPVAPPAPTAPVEPPAPTASMAPPEPPAPVAPPEPPAPVAPPEPPAPVAPPEPPAPVAPPEPPAPVAPPEPPAPVAPPRAASGGVSEARKAYYTSQAEALSSLTATLARTRGVTSIFLVAREGVTIDSVAKDAISEARIGELVHESFEFLEAFAKDPSYWVLECAGGIFVMQKLDARHVLIAIGQAGANFGALRYTMDKTKTKFEQILSLTPA